MKDIPIEKTNIKLLVNLVDKNVLFNFETSIYYKK